MCHSGEQTLCGIWWEELEDALDEECGEEYPDETEEAAR